MSKIDAEAAIKNMNRFVMNQKEMDKLLKKIELHSKFYEDAVRIDWEKAEKIRFITDKPQGLSAQVKQRRT